MEAIPFSRHNDMPQKFLFWQIDQVVPLATAIFIGVMTQNMFLYSAMGFFVAWGLGRWRDSRPDGYLQHMLYWYGIVPLKARCAINPFVRKFFPL
jgi:conjugal transfer pilus assembly protein TraL